jgi:hypothetical protein
MLQDACDRLMGDTDRDPTSFEMRAMLRASEALSAQSNEPIEDLDLDLLRKLASGNGGRRTGALRRSGYLEWTVTPAGRRALDDADTKE